MSELAGVAAGGHVDTTLHDFDITNAAELEAHVNIRATAARHNFEKYYAERLTDVSKYYRQKKKRLDVQNIIQAPTVIYDVSQRDFSFDKLAQTFQAELEQRAEAKAARAYDREQGNSAADVLVDTRFDQDQPVKLKLTGVDYTNVDKAVLALVHPALGAERLDLSNNGLSDEEAADLAPLLRDGHHFKEVDLSGNPLGNEGVEKLADALLQNSSLVSLDLGGIGMSKSGATHLAKYLTSPNCTLQRLQLGGNKLGIYGCEVLAEALARNTSLLAVGLQNNAMGNDGLTKLKEIAFPGGGGGDGENPQEPVGNNTIVQLGLADNKADDGPADAILRVVFANDQRQARLELDRLQESERAKLSAEVEQEYTELLSLVRRALEAIEAKKSVAEVKKGTPSAPVAAVKGAKAPVAAVGTAKAPAAAASRKGGSISPTKKAPAAGAPPAPKKAPAAPSKTLMSAKVAAKGSGRTPSPPAKRAAGKK